MPSASHKSPVPAQPMSDAKNSLRPSFHSSVISQDGYVMVHLVCYISVSPLNYFAGVQNIPHVCDLCTSMVVFLFCIQARVLTLHLCKKKMLCCLSLPD